MSDELNFDDVFDVFETSNTAKPSIVDYKDLGAGSTYFRMLSNKTDADGNWLNDLCVSVPMAVLRFPAPGKKDGVFWLNYIMTGSKLDPAVVLGHLNPDAVKVKAQGGQFAFKQPSKARTFIPVTTCVGPDDEILGTPTWLSLSYSQFSQLAGSVAKLGSGKGRKGNCNPRGMLLEVSIDPKADNKEKYNISVMLNEAEGVTDEQYAEAIETLKPVLIARLEYESQANGGYQLWSGKNDEKADANAKLLWRLISTELGMTPEEIVNQFYVGKNARINSVPIAEMQGGYDLDDDE